MKESQVNFQPPRVLFALLLVWTCSRSDPPEVRGVTPVCMPGHTSASGPNSFSLRMEYEENEHLSLQEVFGEI